MNDKHDAAIGPAELFADELFAAEETAKYSTESLLQTEAWKVLIIDDEEDVHAVTRLVLRGFSFEGKKLKFLDAYSAEEGRQILQENPDIAIVLLDVVMESTTAGLDLVEHIRKKLGNQFVRIVVRTGQPGHAPESRVVAAYDIDDYELKTELTAEKLFTVIISSLRAYKTIRAIDTHRRELAQEVEEQTRELEDKEEQFRTVADFTYDWE